MRTNNSSLPLKPETRLLCDILLANDYVRNFGGIVYGNRDIKDQLCNRKMLLDDFRSAIDELSLHGISVRRFDSGGSPSWALEDEP